ncbi:MAG: hypothetical protein K2P55_18910 [Bacteroides acidifaciens]|uniref:type II toxin-antitoxin system RelE family toxin n=1 Tax=Bacteroides acidifaciens TaxID=85831 RepID=UPI0023C660EB|nr:hypothetical protein [Bacteroides acidifaciens]MDE6821844.1 hypothetical protein [Bacteroides acidifaciens]MDE6988920.1 hypothetical protein [Bacteroides acidifaciens]
MKVEFSKTFIKAASKLSGKPKESLQKAILEVEQADNINKITDCKKMVDFNYIYRIRIGSYRAFFIFHVQIKDDVVLFQYLLSRGEAYSKKNEESLRLKDR